LLNNPGLGLSEGSRADLPYGLPMHEALLIIKRRLEDAVYDVSLHGSKATEARQSTASKAWIYSDMHCRRNLDGLVCGGR
jgi:hypothetical protein